MRRWVIVFLLGAACGGGEEVNASSMDMGMADTEPDVTVDAAIADPPANLAPCEATTCREEQLGGPPCSSYSLDGDFGGGDFGVHAYTSMVWDGALTNIRVESKGGGWTPVIILARLNGEVLFDGDVGAVRPPFEVDATGPADIEVSTVQATGIVVYVTSAKALESNFESSVPADAAYTLTIDSDCGGERLRCVVNGRDVGEPACAWLHYVGKRVVRRLDGDLEERVASAARVAWWSLKQGNMSLANPVGRSSCGAAELGPLQLCETSAWRVGLAGVKAGGRDVAQLEELASRLYDGAMPSGVLRTTANEAGLDRADSAAVMASTDALRASWLLRNTAVGFTTQEFEVDRDCIQADTDGCFGSGWDETRLYAPNREAAYRSIEDLQSLLEQMAQ